MLIINVLNNDHISLKIEGIALFRLAGLRVGIGGRMRFLGGLDELAGQTGNADGDFYQALHHFPSHPGSETQDFFQLGCHAVIMTEPLFAVIAVLLALGLVPGCHKEIFIGDRIGCPGSE